MERLTMNNGLCQMASTEFCLAQKDCYSCPHGRKCFKALAAYEDTGLEPEEYKKHADAIKKLDIEHMHDLLQAEKDGRLVVLPCKVGDTVWTNVAIVGDRYKSADRPYPVEVAFIGMGGDSGFFHVQYSNGRIFPFDFDKIGKTIFLTREEAEATLKKREEADHEQNKN